MDTARRAILAAALFLAVPLAARAGDGATVSGFVRDLKGGGVAGVPVTWRLVPKGDTKFHAWQDVFTDAKGRYEIAGLVPGDLDFGVWAEMNLFEGTDLHVTTIVKSEPIARDFVVEGSVSFAGKVEIPGDAPVRVALLRRAEYVGGWTGCGGGTSGRVATLGADRSFRFGALCPGMYVLYLSGAGTEPVERVIELTGDVRDYVVAPRTGGEIAGRLTLPPGAEKGYRYVRLETPDGRQAGSSDGSGADTSFSFKNVPPGRYRVEAHVGHKTFGEGPERDLNGSAAVEMTAPARRVETAPIALVQDADVGLAVKLPRGATRIEGKVRVRGGTWDYQRFTAESAADGTTSISPILGMTMSDPFSRPDGSLRLFGVAEGSRLHVVVEAFGYLPEECEADVNGAMTVSVPLRRAPGRLVELGFQPWSLKIGYHRVEVRDAEKGGEWTSILFGDERSRPSDMPAPEGTAGFLAPGRYEFRLTTDRRPTATLGPVEIGDRPDDPLGLEFHWDQGHTISGELHTRPGGHRAERVLRLFRVEDGRSVAMPERDSFASGGKYEFSGLVSGRYRVAIAPSGAGVLAEIDITDADVKADLCLER